MDGFLRRRSSFRTGVAARRVATRADDGALAVARDKQASTADDGALEAVAATRARWQWHRDKQASMAESVREAEQRVEVAERRAEMAERRAEHEKGLREVPRPPS